MIGKYGTFSPSQPFCQCNENAGHIVLSLAPTTAKVLSASVTVCNLRCILAVNRHKPALPQQRLSWQSMEGVTVADGRRSSATLAATNLCLYRWFTAHLRLVLSDTRDFAQTFTSCDTRALHGSPALFIH